MQINKEIDKINGQRFFNPLDSDSLFIRSIFTGKPLCKSGSRPKFFLMKGNKRKEERGSRNELLD